MVEIYDKYIKDIYAQEQWGYSVAYYLTATYNCNPNYARFYSNKLNISNAKIEEILQNIKGDERAMFSEKLAREILERQNF